MSIGAGWEAPTNSPKEFIMNQEQFGQFWDQLKAPLKAKWDKITDEDLADIQGKWAQFAIVLQKRYGELQKEEVTMWANRRYAHWSGNYIGYKDPAPGA
jgi:uncharacterized protein YjbJ (UPF0337 family)